MKKLVLAMGMACAMLGAFGAKTVYVDRSADPATADGTQAHPYVTIQKGVDEVEAGGTVWVGPGVYDQGERADADGASNRVYITKSLTLRATGDRDATVIRGASTPSATTLGLGDQSVRCLAVTNDSNLTVKIYGFTFSGGRSCNRDNGTAQNANYAGGVYGNNYSGGTDLYDCRIDDCAATRGGAAYHVRLFRCLVTGCRSSNVGAVGREMRAYHSVFFRNGAQGSSLFAYSLALHSCTVIENGTFCFTSPHEDAYNCIFMQNVGGVGSAGFGHIVASVTDDTTALEGDTRGNSFGAYGDCVFGPLAGDFRVVKGYACDGTGDVSQLPSAFRDYDYLGNPRLTGDKMNVGAVESSATPVGSLAVGEGFVGATSSDFPPVTCATHLHADRLPASVTLKMPLPENYNATKGGKGYLMVTNTVGEEVYLDWDDTVALPARPFAADGSPVKYVPVTVNALWVDRVNGNDATGTYSAPSNNPYQSLQAAANVLEPNWGEGVIYVRKGRYDNGGSTYYDQTNRLYLAKSRKVRLVAVEGPAVTTIVGGSDSTRETGCGPAAVRCICAAGGTTIVTGFALTGGRSGHDDPAAGDANNQRKRGGLAYRQYDSGTTKNLTFFNCEITDCQGEQGSIAYSARFVRCRIHGCTRSLAVQSFVDCRFVSTVLWDIGPTEGMVESEIFGSSCTLYNVTVGPCTFRAVTTSTKGYNSILAAGNGRDLKSSSAVALKTSLFESTNIDPSVIETDPRFEGSVMAPSGILPDQGLKIIHGSQAKCRATYANMYALCPVDVYGRPFTVGADGKFEAGAVAGAVPGAFCSSTYAGGISPAAVGFDADGNATVTATVTTRPLLGFEVDGEMHETREREFTFSRSQVTNDDFTVTAVYGTEFWADAVNGKETNSGFYPDDAKLYIGSALDLTEDGDTVVAMPGEYKEEPPRFSGENTIGSRVVVPAHRTLRSRDGAETTFIVGAASPNPVRDYGLGPGAVRCAYLNNDTKIQGFTLTGGHTSAPETGNTPDNEDHRGGGVLASGVSGREVVDCVITGCASLRGGGACNVTLRRCRVVGNQAVWFGSAAAYCNMSRCFIDNNVGGNTCYLYQGQMEGCTVGANNMNGVSSSTHCGVYLQSTSAEYHIFNSIFAAGSVTAMGGTNIYDCAFAPGIAVVGTNEFANCVFGEVQLTADGTPVIGHNVGVDRGNPALMSEEDLGRDLDGTTRIWNNAIDVGAIEADWRAHYSKALCKRRLAVDDAPETAEEQPNGQIRLTDGALTATWDPIPGGSYGRTLNYSVPGTGTLTVSVDGEVVDTVTAGQTRSYAFDSGLAANALSFRYEPGDGDALGALIGPFKDNRGALLIVR